MANMICTPNSRINIEMIISDLMLKSNFNTEVHVTDSMDLVYSVEIEKLMRSLKHVYCPITNNFPVFSPIFFHGTVYIKESIEEHIFLECQKDDLLFKVDYPV